MPFKRFIVPLCQCNQNYVFHVLRSPGSGVSEEREHERACADHGSLLLTSKVLPSPSTNTGSSINLSVRGQTRLLATLAWLPLAVAPKDPPRWLPRLSAVAKDATELLLRAQCDSRRAGFGRLTGTAMALVLPLLLEPAGIADCRTGELQC